MTFSVSSPKSEPTSTFLARISEDVTPSPPVSRLVDSFIEKLHHTYVLKNTHYGNSFFSSLESYGLISALTRMGDKFRRMEHLILHAHDGEDTDESLQDTMLDMACYCLMSAVYLEGGRTHDMEETHPSCSDER